MSDMQPAIQVRSITKRFGRFKAVHDVSFDVPTGQIVGFVGANGAGKSTTINMLMGFIAPSDGDIQIDGRMVTPQRAHRVHKTVGYAAGDMELPGGLTGEQYLDFLLSQTNVDHTDTTAMLLRRFKPQLDKKIRSLSRGNKQKIALVAAFASEPDVIILDEPTSGLDPVMQETFLDYVRELKSAGKTVFMSSHYLQEVTEVCDRIMLMSHGHIVQDLTKEELLRNSGKHVVVRTGYVHTKPPRGAESVEISKTEDGTTISFVYKSDIEQLQRWLAGIKKLQDVEVSEYNLEGAFSSLYEAETGENEEDEA
jgi:ABC-2 type transport system ATP-binding protein